MTPQIRRPPNSSSRRSSWAVRMMFSHYKKSAMGQVVQAGEGPGSATIWDGAVCQIPPQRNTVEGGAFSLGGKGGVAMIDKMPRPRQ
eukprot:8670877-Pyramimonas_sp.AAC.1